MGMVGYMNGVLVDLAQARSALQVAAGRASELIRLLPDPLAPVPGLEWTVGQTAAHMVAAPMNYLCYATGQAEPEVTIDLRAGNLERIERVGSQDLSELADLLVEQTDRYLNGTGNLSDDHPVPFFGGTTVSLAAQTGIMLGEYVVHGRHLARSAGRPSHIDPSYAILVIAAITAVIPRYLNREVARGVNVAYEIRVRGGPRFIFRVAGNKASVEPGSGVPVDCRISADPVAFLLVTYGRQAQWRPVLVGRMTGVGSSAMASLGVKASAGQPIVRPRPASRAPGLAARLRETPVIRPAGAGARLPGRYRGDRAVRVGSSRG
jgi:uncharacterized protein (TIGR03083 family)